MGTVVADLKGFSSMALRLHYELDADAAILIIVLAHPFSASLEQASAPLDSLKSGHVLMVWWAH